MLRNYVGGARDHFPHRLASLLLISVAVRILAGEQWNARNVGRSSLRHQFATQSRSGPRSIT
jgi:hypothetical protein